MKPYNPSAFPSPGVVFQSGMQQGAYEGMSLRDYFAAHAPMRPGWFERTEYKGPTGTLLEHPLNAEVRWRYHYADAMLLYRETT